MLSGSGTDDQSSISAPFLLLTILATVLVCILSIDSQSFWMDELGTWQYAGAAGVRAWFEGFLKVANSDGQLPLYHFLAFIWSRIMGLSEVGLRSLNGFFLLLAIIPLAWRSGLSRGTAAWWIALLLSNCFIWAYLNEARPYIMLLAGSVLFMLALARAAQGEALGRPVDMGAILTLFFTGSLLSFGASPTAAPFIALSALGILWLVGPANWSNIARIGLWQALWCLFCTLIALAVAALILYSLAKGATPELRNSTSIATTLFGLLEVMGGGGYVPGRDVLRVQGIHAVHLWQWAALVVLTVGWAVGVVQALRGPERRLALILLILTLLSMACVVAAGFVIGFRVVGRHFAFAVPPLLLLLAIGVKAFDARAKWVGGAFCLLLLLSTALFRLDGDHRKDDTASAAEAVKVALARGERSWWIGGYLIPLYFNVPTKPLAMADQPGAAVIKAEDGEDWGGAMHDLPVPDVILIERPEVNDAEGNFASFAAHSGLTKRHLLRGYVVYSRD